MKTLIRTAIIVIASLLVIGGAFAYVQYGGNALLTSGPGRGEFGQLPEGGTRPQRGTNEGDPAFTPPQGDFAGEGLRREGGREGGGLRGLTEVFKNLGIMAVITLVVVIVGVAWRAVSSKLRRPPTAVAPPPPPAQPAA